MAVLEVPDGVGEGGGVSTNEETRERLASMTFPFTREQLQAFTRELRDELAERRIGQRVPQSNDDGEGDCG